MSLVESKDGLQHFTFEHNRDYQQVQFKFFDAVESMDPNNIVVIVLFFGCIHTYWRLTMFYVMSLFRFFTVFIQVLLQLNPYHIDSVLQLSDVCHMQDDQETARDLIGETTLSVVVNSIIDFRKCNLGLRTFKSEIWNCNAK